MQKEFITTNSIQTQELGKLLSEEVKNGGIICLSGELGAGKTTFTQGLLGGLGLEGPFTSPTFLIMKEYKRENSKSKIQKVYHIDAYRIGVEDILALGWEEMVANKNNVIIIEWAERVRDIIPEDALRIYFGWIGEKERKIILSNIQITNF